MKLYGGRCRNTTTRPKGLAYVLNEGQRPWNIWKGHWQENHHLCITHREHKSGRGRTMFNFTKNQTSSLPVTGSKEKEQVAYLAHGRME